MTGSSSVVLPQQPVAGGVPGVVPIQTARCRYPSNEWFSARKECADTHLRSNAGMTEETSHLVRITVGLCAICAIGLLALRLL